MTTQKELSKEEYRQISSEQYYQDLRRSFEEGNESSPCDPETYALLLEGLEDAKKIENEEYSRKHMRIYGMLRQAMDYVHDVAPEKIEDLKAFVSHSVRDIGPEEWKEMTRSFSTTNAD